MSSIRLYILDALARRGEMHGHQLRLLAEQEHVHLWTDFSVGALYGALKRLAAEGLLAEVRDRARRQLPGTAGLRHHRAGPEVLDGLHRQRPRAGRVPARPLRPGPEPARPDRLDELPDALEVRLAALRSLLEDTERQNERARPYLSLGETHALLHREHRLRAEIAWHTDLLAALPDVIADERVRAQTPDPLPTAAPEDPKDTR